MRMCLERLPKNDLHGQKPIVTLPTKAALAQFESQQKTRPIPPTPNTSRGPPMQGPGGPMQGNAYPGQGPQGPPRMMMPNGPNGPGFRPHNMPPQNMGMPPNQGPPRMQVAIKHIQFDHFERTTLYTVGHIRCTLLMIYMLFLNEYDKCCNQMLNKCLCNTIKIINIDIYELNVLSEQKHISIYQCTLLN